MSGMTVKVSFLAGVSLREALAEAKEKAEQLGIAYVEFYFNGVRFAVSPQADIEKGVRESSRGE